MLSKFVVLIPARNEEESLPDLITKIISSITKHVLVIDNNSSDQTAALAKKAGAVVIHEQKLGYGSACLAGIRYLSSLTHPPKYICFFDGDGQSSVEDIVRVAKPVLSGKTKYCQGSRMILQSSARSLSPMARIANPFFANLLSLTWRQSITDLGPLRVMSWYTLSSLKMSSTGFGWTIEMSSKLLKRGITYCEVPVQYKKRHTGKSKISGNFKAAVRAAFVMGLTFLYVLILWRPSTAI